MSAIRLIAAERQRQVGELGWTPEHDDAEENKGQLAEAAACYAAGRPIYRTVDQCVQDERDYGTQYKSLWPWEPKYDNRHKHPRLRQLVIAGALIVAEIERLQRSGVIE